MRRDPLLLMWIPLCAGLVQCAQPLHAPSAFSDERYLCNTAEFDALVAKCHDDYLRDGSCRGWVSFRGIIDSQSVVVDSQATKVVPPRIAFPGAAPAGGLQVWGAAPYFEFRFGIIDPATPGVGSVGSGATPLSLTTTSVDHINIEARGGNDLLVWINETRQVQILAADEVRFNFAADLLRGGNLEGCLDVFLGNNS